MDERIRLIRRVRTVLRIAQWVLLFYVVITGARLWLMRTEAKGFRQWTLEQAWYPLVRAFDDYADSVPRELALMPPPENPAQLDAWADSVQVRAGNDAGVFILKNGSVNWVRRPQSLGDDAAAFETRLADTTHRGARLPYGSTEVRMIVVKDGRKYDRDRVAEIVGAPDQPLRWGILHRRMELWRPLFAHVSQFVEHKPGGGPTDPLTERLNGFIQVEKLQVHNEDWSTHPTVRVSLDGDVLFTSPGLDTTRVSKVDTVGGARVEFFVSDQDNVFAGLFGGKGWPWLGFLLWIALLVGNELCYRWLRRVDKPKPEPQILVAKQD
jgi:hypothetical protein